MKCSRKSYVEKYKVLKDTREQEGWEFPNMEVVTLKTGDYTIEGYEKDFVIERKGSISEFCQNLTQKRFEKELQRLEDFAHPFIFLEFYFDKLILFPEGSGIPRYIWPKLRVTPGLLLKRLAELQMQYKTKILFVGDYGKQMAISLFYRVINDRKIITKG